MNLETVTKTDVFQAKARLAEATSKRIEAENNLDISISDFETVVGRKPDINWFNSDKSKNYYLQIQKIGQSLENYQKFHPH